MSDDQNDGRMSFEAAVHYIQQHPGSAAFTAMPVFGERSEDEDQRAEGAKVFILEADGAGSYRLRFIAGPFFASVLGDEDIRRGYVVSDKMQKTVVVKIDRRVPHPVYGKMVTRTTKVKAHDEENAAKRGDTVRIMETRPLSKSKRWRLVEIIEKAK